MTSELWTLFVAKVNACYRKTGRVVPFKSSRFMDSCSLSYIFLLCLNRCYELAFRITLSGRDCCGLKTISLLKTYARK